FFFSSRRRHTRSKRDWSSDVCSSDLVDAVKTSHSSSCRRRWPPGVSESLENGACRFRGKTGVREERPSISRDFGKGAYCSISSRSEERRVGTERRTWRVPGTYRCYSA